jgi:hypothetical protein
MCNAGGNPDVNVTWAPMTYDADDALRYIYISRHVGLTMFDRVAREGSQTHEHR